MKIFLLLLKLLITLIIGQTLFFKFSGAVESVYIFNTLGVEPWGRILLGLFELTAIVLLWIPQTNIYALVLIVCFMLGAIASHLFILGIEIMDDKGELFILAIVTCAAAAILLFSKREELKKISYKVFSRKQVV